MALRPEEYPYHSSQHFLLPPSCFLHYAPTLEVRRREGFLAASFTPNPAYPSPMGHGTRASSLVSLGISTNPPI